MMKANRKSFVFSIFRWKIFNGEVLVVARELLDNELSATVLLGMFL